MSTIFDNFYESEFSGFIDDTDYGNLTETPDAIDGVEKVDELFESDDMGDRISLEKPKKKKKAVKSLNLETDSTAKGSTKPNSQPTDLKTQNKGNTKNTALIFGVILLGFGVFMLTKNR